ncbi:MAG: NUDIX hydrolase [Candidatus Woesearchaeota archaeon]
MSKEIIAVVDEKDNIIGSTTREEAHTQGLRHREIYIYFISNKKVLLQRRKDNGLWDHSVGGHVGDKENYITAAIREIEEELGIKVSREELEEIAYKQFDYQNDKTKNITFSKVFLLNKPISLNNIAINKNELFEVEFFTKHEIEEILLDKRDILTYHAKRILKNLILKKLDEEKKE